MFWSYVASEINIHWTLCWVHFPIVLFILPSLLWSKVSSLLTCQCWQLDRNAKCVILCFYFSTKALSMWILFDDLCRKGTLFKLWSWKSGHLFSSLTRSKMSSRSNHWFFQNCFTTFKVREGGKKLAFF